MALPRSVMLKLAKLNISSYEWRSLLVILAELYAKDTNAVTIPLDLFVQTTRIKKPHVVRALNKLEDRNIITRVSYKRNTSYAFQDDSTSWKSLLTTSDGNGKPVKYSIKAAFDDWFEKYPNAMHEADAEALYAELVVSGEATIDELDEALDGYINHELHRAEKFNRDPDPWYCMYPTSFLKGKWKEYAKYKEIKSKPRL